MMKNEIEITGFRLYRIGNSELRKKNFVPRTEKDLINEGLEGIPATVPGCVERDLAAAGLFPADVAYGDNILRCRELERTHFYYATAFDIGDGDEETILRFDGIDTAAEIFIDGKLLGKTENMLIPHEFPLFGLTRGEHELLVHIIPVSVYVDDKEVPASCWALSYSLDNLCVRKAPYMFGWDIMPRAVSAGLWRSVKLCRLPATRLEDVFLRVNKMNPQCADVSVRCALRTDADDFSRFTIGVHGECDDSVFDHKTTIFGVHNDVRFNIENPKIWQPRGYGKQHLYNVTVTVYYDEKAVCSENFRTGLRTVYLDRGKTADGKAKFDFIVNGKPVFILGTNIVPADVFPAVGDTLTDRELALVTDIGCNAVRIWGGGVYRSDEFYDRCDEYGILVWQDFMMACGIYPQNEEFAELLRKEAISVVKRLRNHPSVALWAGDNECDDIWLMCGNYGRITGTRGEFPDPNDNILTRNILPSVVAAYDGTRSYLPSSPYRDRESAITNSRPPEDHLWGPRGRFKDDFYAKNDCRFVSETGYQGCPAPASLSRFIRPDHLDKRGDGNLCTDPDWLLHAVCPEVDPHSPYTFRLLMMTRQVDYLFGNNAATLPLKDYSLASQIAQAEAMKFFIERLRADKGNRSGIIWWNLIDGFPEISDAVVDNYGCKKLAYSYIKRSQAPVCMIFDEPDADGNLTLIAVNDTLSDVSLRYSVSDAISGETLLFGPTTIRAEGKTSVCKLYQTSAKFLLTEWHGDADGINHFVTCLNTTVSFEKYREFMKNSGFDSAIEGF